MRIDRIREAELNKRKGSSIRMIVQLIWLGLSTVGAYFLSNYIFANTELTIGFLRTNIFNFISPTLPEWVIQAVFVVFIVIVLQAVFFVGYAFGSPEGKVKTGMPRVDSRNPDPFDDDRPY